MQNDCVDHLNLRGATLSFSRAGIVPLLVSVLLGLGCEVEGPGRELGIPVAYVTVVDSVTSLTRTTRGWRGPPASPALILFDVASVSDLRAILDLGRSAPPATGYAPAFFPSDLAETPAREKKRLFTESLRPIITFYNRIERRRRNELSRATRSSVAPILTHYGIDDYPKRLRDYRDTLNVLSFRVGPVPLGVILGQGALESGWGTSRLVREQNNPFGMKRGSGGYAEFNSLGGAVQAYLRNVNTHGAYSDLRNRRRALLNTGHQLRSADLIPHLHRYSSRGNAYLEDLRTLIVQNKLDH